MILRIYISLTALSVTRSRRELKAASDDVARRLTEALERFTPEEWLEKHAAASDEDFAKDSGRNRLAVVLSRTNHMSYHLGQIMLAHNPY